MFHMVPLNSQVFIEGDQGCRKINKGNIYIYIYQGREWKDKTHQRRPCGRKQKNWQDKFWGFHSSTAENSTFLGSDAVSLSEWLLTFRKIVVPPSSSASSPRRMQDMKIQEPLSFKTMGTTHPTTKCHIQDLKCLHRGDFI